MADQVQQFPVEVEATDRDEIHDADGHAFLQQCGTLRHEDGPMLGTILVGGAYEFDRGDEMSIALRIIDANFVFVLFRQGRFDGDVWFGRSPDRRRDTGILDRSAETSRFVGFERSDVDLDHRSEMDSRFGKIAGRKLFVEFLNHGCRPLTMESFPR